MPSERAPQEEPSSANFGLVAQSIEELGVRKDI